MSTVLSMPGLRLSGWSTASALRHHPTRAMLGVLAIALVYWLWLGLTQRSVEHGDAISLLAIEGILERGYPVVPSGDLYHRAYIPNYLVAAVAQVIGLNQLSIMLPALFMALGTIWLTYAFARDAMGRPWLGVLAVVLILLAKSQAFYATSPRMYESVQFFTILATYSAWRGYLQGDRRFQWITLLSITAAILSHRQGAALLLAIPASVLLLTWWRTRSVPSVSLRLSLAGFVLGGAAFGFMFYGGSLAGSAQASGPSLFGFVFDPVLWVRHFFKLESLLPLGHVLLPVCVYLLVMRLRRGRGDMDLAALFLFAVFAIAGLLLVMRWPESESGARMWFFLLPSYSLLVTYGVLAVAESFGLNGASRLGHRITGWRVPALLLTAALAANVLIGTVGREIRYMDVLLKAGYGIPCRASNCNRGIAQHYEVIGQALGAGDTIITSNPAVTQYYLGRVDGLLRERIYEGGKLVTMSSPSDDQFDVPVVDTVEELRGLLDAPGRVWVIADYKIGIGSTEEMQRFLEKQYAVHFEHPVMTSYVNR